MKTLLIALAAAGLTGCAVYPAAPGYGSYESGVAPGYVAPPIYLYGSGIYRYGAYPSPYVYPYSYYSPRFHPRFYPGAGPRPGFGGRGYGGGPGHFGGGHSGHR